MGQSIQETSKGAHLSCLTSVAILFGLSFLGLCAGIVFSFFPKDRFFTPWYSLGTPPEPAEKILAASPFSIEIVASSGNQYTFQPNQYWPESLQGTWVSDDTFIKKDLQEPICDFDVDYASSPKSAKIKDYAALAWCPEIIIYIQYAILEDGSVWRWNSSSNHSLIPIEWLIGTGIGCLVGIIFIIRKMDKQKDDQS